MDALIWLLGTVGGWIVKKLLDEWYARWKERRASRKPLTDAEVLAAHRQRFFSATGLSLWCAIMFAASIATAPPSPGVLWYGLVAFIAVAGIAFAYRLPRYWRRVRASRAMLARSGKR